VPSDPRARTRNLLAACACAAAAWCVSVAALERLARWAEARPNVYLWWWEEWMQLFSPNNYVGRGDGRVLLCGASEMREGFLVDELALALPGHSVYQDACSLATLQSVRLRLEYIETVHGPSAMPDAVVLGLTPRFCLDLPPTAEVPAIAAIDRYSPRARVDFGQRPPRLAEKGLMEGLAARRRLLAHQGVRYRAAVMAAGMALQPGALEHLGRGSKLRPPKWHRHRPLDQGRYAAVAAETRRTWSYALAPESVRFELGAIRDLCARHGTLLVPIEMPQASWVRATYPDGFRTEYRALVQDALGGAPPLDLELLLADAEFFDWAHPTEEGARRITRAAAQRVAELLP